MISTSVLPYGVQLDYPADTAVADLDRDLLSALSTALRTEGIALLRGFPSDPAALVALGRRFGLPQRLLATRAELPADVPLNWAVDVVFRGDLAEADRFDFVEGAKPLELHTARATAAVQPQLFLMHMANASEPDADSPDHGQSHFARLDDALDHLVAEHGRARADEIVRVLSTSTFEPIDSCRAEPVVAAILTKKDNGRWKMRVWEGIADHAARNAPPALADAVTAFYAALNTVRCEVTLTSGDLILLDNERVAHGRRGFPAWHPGPDGDRVQSRRHIRNIKVYSEFEVVA
ncbi:hypothetical protein GCM10023148_18270 [Actinokineospora soli]